MYQKHKISIILMLLCGFLIFFFNFLYKYDNKYITAAPYGQDGILLLTEEDFYRKLPIYLIDGWLLTDSTANSQETYIGEFSNLQRGDLNKKPHGRATYELTLRYTGRPRIVAVDFPELFSKYKIYVDGEQLSAGMGNARLLFQLKQGDNLLTVKTSSINGYYSGMYFPGALGDESTITNVDRIKTISYSICLFCGLILMSFTLQLWRYNNGNRPAFWLASLCISFMCYTSYYFVQLFALPFAPIWYFMEEISFYALVFCMLKLTLAITGVINKKNTYFFTALATVLPALLLTLHATIPYWTYAVVLHGYIKNIYYISIFLGLLGASILCMKRKRSEYPYITAGNLIFGIGLLINVLQSNLFEPIYTLWQFEWCGLLLVLLFSSMMVARNRRIIQENKQFSTHLESLVMQRTEELSCVIEERRAFFSDMAHDLKSPLVATKAFIEAIRTHSVGIDNELAYYLDQLDSKQTEMSKRVQSLNAINTLDRIEDKKERLSISNMLDEIYSAYNAEAEVSAVHMIIHRPENDCFVFIQQEKLLLVFENLIFNALHATPKDGSITITAKKVHNMVNITVDDTGCGISEAELPFIFKRFYVGEHNKTSGSGLGLYIVKTVLEEAGGRISATSQIGSGTSFLLEIPQSM